MDDAGGQIPAKVEVVEQDCLDECPMGPNCAYDPDGDGILKVINKVKTQDDVASALEAMGMQLRSSQQE